MSDLLLVHVTGLLALALNGVAVVCSCERTLRARSGLAGIVWALNNHLLGADAAAALGIVSASRAATSIVTMRVQRARHPACAAFCALTVGAAALTWCGWPAVVMTFASLLSTVAFFYLQGRALRWVLVLVSALWMLNACALGSWEQICANLLSGGAALWGVWKLRGACGSQSRPAANRDLTPAGSIATSIGT